MDANIVRDYGEVGKIHVKEILVAQWLVKMKIIIDIIYVVSLVGELVVEGNHIQEYIQR